MEILGAPTGSTSTNGSPASHRRRRWSSRGTGEVGSSREDRRQAQVGDGGQRPAQPGCGYATGLWRLGGELAMLGEAGGVQIYRWRGWGYVAPPKLSRSSARRRGAPTRRGQGFRAHTATMKLEDEHRRWLGRKTGERAHYGFGRDVPVLAAAAPASASGREGQRAMIQRRWRCAAVIGELWNDHASNKHLGAA